MSTQIDVLKRFFDAINRFDMEAIVEDLDPDIVRVEPEGFPTSGTYRGIESVRQQVRSGRGSWAEGSCNPEGFFEKGDKVVVYLYACVRMHNQTEWIGGRFADGFTFRNGKIVDYITFVTREDAMKWAGIEEKLRT